MPKKQSLLSNLCIVTTLIHEFGHAVYVKRTACKYKINYEPTIILIGSEYITNAKPNHTVTFKNYIFKFYAGDQSKGCTLSPHFVNFNTEEISKASIAGYRAENIFTHVFCIISYVILFVLLCTLHLPRFGNIILFALSTIVIYEHVTAIKDNNKRFTTSKDYQNYIYPEKFDCQYVRNQYQHYKNPLRYETPPAQT